MNSYASIWLREQKLSNIIFWGHKQEMESLLHEMSLRANVYSAPQIRTIPSTSSQFKEAADNRSYIDAYKKKFKTFQDRLPYM